MPKTKEEEEKEKVLPILIFIGLGAGGLTLWLLRRKIEPDKAILYGLVTDAETHIGIADIAVDCDGHTAKTDGNGEYAIINIPPATYEVTFTDPYARYEPATV